MKNFFTIEGVEGSGKTTAIGMLEKMLIDAKIEYIITREPGGVDPAEAIRDLIMNYQVDVISEAMLFATARRIHLIEKVIPALNEGKIVISDRFIHSSYAYQGHKSESDFVIVKNLNEIAITVDREVWYPQKTFFLDIKPEESLKRLVSRDEINHFDQRNIDFHKKVYNHYKKQILENPDQWCIINAQQTPELIATKIFKEIKKIKE